MSFFKDAILLVINMLLAFLQLNTKPANGIFLDWLFYKTWCAENFTL